MNETLKVLGERLSIRSYQNKPIEADKMEAIKAAFMASASSINGQPVSVIVVKDEAVKASLSQLSYHQPHINQAPVFLVFCLDTCRTKQIFDLNDAAFEQQGTLDELVTTVFDAGLSMTSVMVAARSLGLDSVPIGALRSSATEVASLLQLPTGVFPICGLCLGYASHDVSRVQKAKMSASMTWHEEIYHVASIEALNAYNEAIADHFKTTYDAEGNYYTHMLKYYTRNLNPNLATQLKKQGFLTK